jgi:hypothetical protein
MRKFLALAALTLAAGPHAAAAQPYGYGQGYGADPSRAESWEIGPIIRGRNRSVGMPLQPSPARRGWYFDFPYPHAGAGHVHYVTFPHGSLAGKRRIVMRYRVDAAPGVRFVSQESPERPGTISLYFQRGGDTWTARGIYDFYRWYAPRHSVARLTPGEHVMSVNLDASWLSVTWRPAGSNARLFEDALAETEQVGFVLGDEFARGHGVYATGPARLTVLSFQVL